MNKRDIKHRDELYKASAIISQLGFVPDESMCDDCPDLILPSVDNRKIGIEVVTYSTQIYEQSENALYKILDEYVKNHHEAEIDYIHGEDSLKKLASRDNSIGFIFDGMQKNELFDAIKQDGSLPRKTFSMGHASDKRFYIEARKI